MYGARNKAKLQGKIEETIIIILKIDNFLQLMVSSGTISMINCKGDETIYLVQNAHRPLPRKIVAKAVQYKTPPLGKFKLNSDVSVVGDQAKEGDVLRDHEGTIMFALPKILVLKWC